MRPAPGADAEAPTNWTRFPHTVQSRTTFSSSRSKSAFTPSSSARSILTWTVSGSEPSRPAAIASSTIASASAACSVTADRTLKDIALVGSHVASVAPRQTRARLCRKDEFAPAAPLASARVAPYANASAGAAVGRDGHNDARRPSSALSLSWPARLGRRAGQ
jgi:hypothetical protein